MIEPWMVMAAVVTGIAGVFIGNRKGHPVWGFFAGFLLSVVGLVIVALSRDDRGRERPGPSGG